MRHADLWNALDAVAAQAGLTPSGLARAAGLDATAFNRSKRTGPDGRPRWPSTESLTLALDAAGVDLATFAALAQGRRRPAGHAPILGFARAGTGGYFDDAGFPAGEGWDSVAFPGELPEGVYALEITGESMLPVYRPGDRILVAPGAEARPGDRVVARTSAGEVMAKVLKRRTPRTVTLASLNPAFDDLEFAPEELSWMARILWASQ